MTSHGFGMTTSEAHGERQEMQQLNDKLAQYMQRVRELKKAAAISGDAASYHDAMKQIENEMNKLRDLYDTELNKLRRKLDDAIKEKNKYGADTQRMGDIQGRLGQESNRAKHLEDKVRELEKALADREKENAHLSLTLKKAQNDAAIGAKAARDNEDLKKRLNEQNKNNQDLDDKLKELTDKLRFESKMHDASNRELQERNRAANDIIQSLESKLKQLNKMGDNLPSALQKMREGTVAEMKRFQRETEDALNKNIDSLKKQMDDDAKSKDQLARENRILEDKIRKMASHVADVEAKLKAMGDENRALKNEVENERARAQVVIKELEKKLKDLQDTLLNNSKEFVNARDAQASLKAEIETYRRLLEGESSRLQSRATSRVGTPLKAPTPSYGNPGKSTPALNGTYKPPRMFPTVNNAFHTTYSSDYSPKIKGYY